MKSNNHCNKKFHVLVLRFVLVVCVATSLFFVVSGCEDFLNGGLEDSTPAEDDTVDDDGSEDGVADDAGTDDSSSNDDSATTDTSNDTTNDSGSSDTDTADDGTASDSSPNVYGMPTSCTDTNPNGGRVLLVGPGQTYASPSEVAAVVQVGDMVKISSGVYEGTAATAVWSVDNLIICCPGPGKAHMKAADQNAEGKAIWVIKGNNTIVENIEFSECTVWDHNGAGIRQEGDNVTIRNCYFHHNEEGILTTTDCPNSTIIIE